MNHYRYLRERRTEVVMRRTFAYIPSEAEPEPHEGGTNKQCARINLAIKRSKGQPAKLWRRPIVIEGKPILYHPWEEVPA